jgi:hypothetical protein
MSRGAAKAARKPAVTERDAKAFAAVALREAGAAARRTAPARRANAKRIADLRASVEQWRGWAEACRVLASLPDAELARWARAEQLRKEREFRALASWEQVNLMKACGLAVPEWEFSEAGQ